MIQYSSRFNELSLYLPTKIILNFCFKEAKKKKKSFESTQKCTEKTSTNKNFCFNR